MMMMHLEKNNYCSSRVERNKSINIVVSQQKKTKKEEEEKNNNYKRDGEVALNVNCHSNTVKAIDVSSSQLYRIFIDQALTIS